MTTQTNNTKQSTENKIYIMRIEDLRTLKSSLIYRKDLRKEYPKIKLNLCWNNQEGFFLFGYSDKTIYC